MKKFKIEDEFATALEQKGLLSIAEEEDSKPESKKEEISDIQALYGVKPNGKEYDRNIIEKAHPETVVILPSHDAMNGVLENNNQRQDVMSYIALKYPNGNFIQERYVAAYNELVKSVVKAGFKLDSENEDGLMKLADSCAERLEKQAFLPAALYWGAAGIATLVGAIAAINQTSDSRQNVVANAQRAIAELSDLQGKLPVEHIIQSLTDLIAAATAFNTVKIDVFTPKSVFEAAKTNKEDIKLSQEYNQKLIGMSQYIPQYIEELQTLQPNESAEWDWLQKIKDIARTIVPDDVTDSVNALNGLNKAVHEEVKAVNLVMSRARDQVTNMAKDDSVPKADVQQPQAVKENVSPEEATKINNDYDSLIQQIMS